MAKCSNILLASIVKLMMHSNDHGDNYLGLVPSVVLVPHACSRNVSVQSFLGTGRTRHHISSQCFCSKTKRIGKYFVNIGSSYHLKLEAGT